MILIQVTDPTIKIYFEFYVVIVISSKLKKKMNFPVIFWNFGIS